MSMTLAPSEIRNATLILPVAGGFSGRTSGVEAGTLSGALGKSRGGQTRKGQFQNSLLRARR
jgi:hypothetical protein